MKRRDRTIAVLAVTFAVLVFAATCVRIVRRYSVPGPFNADLQGLCDFHNGLYFPARALLDGISPYSEAYAAAYPVSRPIPLFSPWVLIAHFPLAVLPLRLAEVLFMALQLVLIAAMSSIVVTTTRWYELWEIRPSTAWCVTFAGLMATRAVHATILNGYFTFELILGVWIALLFADRRPLVSGIALLFVAIKPTFVLPLGCLMLARGHFKALLIGGTLSVLLTFGPIAWIIAAGSDPATTSWSDWSSQIQATQASHRAVPSESPVNSWTRIDSLSLIAKWLRLSPNDWVHLGSMFLMLLPAGGLLHHQWRRRKLQQSESQAREQDNWNHGASLTSPTATLLLLTVTISVYHQFYDGLLLVIPAIAIAIGSAGWENWNRTSRITLAIAITAPLWNYASAGFVVGRFENEITTRILTSVNAAALLGSWLFLIAYVYRNSTGGPRLVTGDMGPNLDPSAG